MPEISGRYGFKGRFAGFGSNAIPTGLLREPLVTIMLGSGLPLDAICTVANTTKAAGPVKLEIQRSPKLSKATPAGSSSEFWFVLRTTEGSVRRSR